jgi:hypothetical protein
MRRRRLASGYAVYMKASPGVTQDWKQGVAVDHVVVLGVPEKQVFNIFGVFHFWIKCPIRSSFESDGCCQGCQMLYIFPYPQFYENKPSGNPGQ